MLQVTMAVNMTWLTRIKDAYAEDVWFEKPMHTKELVLKDGVWYRGTAIVLPDHDTLREDIIRESHEPPHSGHMGVRKTTEQVERVCWWPRMRRQIYEYVTACFNCQRDKARNQKPGGLLQPLQIPQGPWESVSLDLITALPLTRSGHTAIVVFVDRLTKMTHFVPTVTEIKATEMAQMFVDTVYRHHRLPKTLISDRDPRFTSKYWSFFGAVETKLCMSSAYHPQSDGQTERMNRVLEDMLRHYVSPSQDDWDQYLGLAEFAVNNSWQEVIKCTPFFANYGFHPYTPFTAQLPTTAVPAVTQRHVNIHEQLQKIKESIKSAQDRQRSYANTKRKDVCF